MTNQINTPEEGIQSKNNRLVDSGMTMCQGMTIGDILRGAEEGLESINPLVNTTLIYVTKKDEELVNLASPLLPTITEGFQDQFSEEVYALFPLFFPNITVLFIPKKIEKNLRRYASKGLLREVDVDLDIAVEKCLLFLNNLATTFYSENKWKSLSSVLLHEQTKRDNDNTYVYSKIIDVLLSGTKESGSMIEIQKKEDGTDYYEIGKQCRLFKLTETYLKVGMTEYKIKSESIIDRRNKTFIRQIIEANDNPICRNLMRRYLDLQLPTTEEIIAEAKKLVKGNYITKKGKKLTFLNKHKEDYWKDKAQRSFVENDIELFLFLVKKNGYAIPSEGSYESGGRIVDSFDLMPSWIRRMIKVKGQHLVEVDYVALHPNLFMNLYGGNVKFITHQMVADELNIDLSVAKREHLSFLNKQHKHMVISPLYKYYWGKVPAAMGKLVNEKKMEVKDAHKIISRKMFKKEVEIMKDVITELNAKGIYVLYIYDALVCEPQHREEVIKVMNEVVIKHKVYTTAK